jgi:hypothetical protein
MRETFYALSKQVRSDGLKQLHEREKISLKMPKPEVAENRTSRRRQIRQFFA